MLGFFSTHGKKQYSPVAALAHSRTADKDYALVRAEGAVPYAYASGNLRSARGRLFDRCESFDAFGSPMET